MKVTLFLAARGLPLSGSSLKVKVSPPEGSEDSVDLGETERQDGTNPTYAKTFSFEYDEDADTSRRITIEVLDEAGSWKCNRSYLVSEILSAKGAVLGKELSSGGVCIAHLSTATASGSLKLQLSGKDLKNLDGRGFLRKSDPFYALMTLNEETGNWDARYKSNSITNNLSPDWPEAEVDLTELCGGDLDATVRVVVFDYDDKKKLDFLNLRPDGGENEVMGFGETSVAKLLEKSVLPMMNKGEQHGHVEVGTAELVDYNNPRDAAVKILEAAGKVEEVRIKTEAKEDALKKAMEKFEELKAALAEQEGIVETAQKEFEEAKFEVESLADLLDQVLNVEE